jgi:hypothetical protein
MRYAKLMEISDSAKLVVPCPGHEMPPMRGTGLVAKPSNLQQKE